MSRKSKVESPRLAAGGRRDRVDRGRADRYDTDMRPEIFPGLKIPVHGYGLMIVIGFLICTYLATREARRRGLPEFVYDLGLVMLFSGILGGRLFYYIQYYRAEFSDRPLWAFFEIWKGGLVFYGGALGGFLGGLIYLRRRRLPLGECLQVTAPFVPIGMGFGRLGCFMNGCCFGKVCSSDFALKLVFPKMNKHGALSGAFEEQLRTGLILESDAAPLPVYPVQLYEAAYDFLLFALLLWYIRGPSPRRGAYPLLFILYGVGRFFLEFLRADNARILLGLTISQLFSLGLIMVFLPLFIFLWNKDLEG